MKNSLLSLLLSIFCVYAPLQAQNDIPIIQSKIFENDKTNKTHALLEHDSTGYYIMRFNNAMNYAEIEHYDTLMRHIKTYPVTRSYRGYVGAISIDTSWYMLYFKYKENPEKKTFEEVSLFANRINKQTFRLESDSIVLIPPFKMESNYYKGNFAVSPNGQKILVYDYEEEGDIEEVRGLTNKINIRVFDHNLEQLWEREVNLAPVDRVKRVVAIKKLRVSNDGEVGILTDIFRNQRSYSMKNITADPTLFFVGKEPENFFRYTPSLGDYFYNQINFTFDESGNVVWFGFYSRHKYYQQAGLFYIKINADRTKVLVKKQHEFDKDFVMRVMRRKRMPKMIEPRSFKLIHWRRSEGGRITISAEHQPYGLHNFRSHGVMLFQFDSIGDINWQRYIHKHADYAQKMKRFMSHYLFTQGTDTYMVYNNGIYSDGFARVIKIDEGGKMRRRVFVLYNDQTEVFTPNVATLLSERKLFLSFEERFFQTYRFGVLDFVKIFEPDPE